MSQLLSRTNLQSVLSIRSAPSIVLMMVALVMAFLIAPRVFSAGGIHAVSSTVAVIGIVGIAVAVVLGVGGLDLSVAGTLEMSAAAGLVVMHSTGGGTGTQILVTMLVAGLAGVVNGFLVAVLRLSSLLATLATSFVFTAIGLQLTGGSPVGDVSSGVLSLGEDSFGFPNAIWVLLGLVAVTLFITARSTWYRRALLIGANRRAAILDGSKVQLVEFSVYVMGSLICGLAALVVTGQLGAFSSGQSGDLLLLALGIALLGGTKLFGGHVSPVGTIAGAVLLALITVVLSLKYVGPSAQQVIQGAVLLVAVSLSARERV